ncbi:bifunctional diguanylate cyclase/phosphodiesterase [Paenibacillus sp. YYML68]|uniref:putative bifunctional diguanylate cyclase/phosphodiesterase n=1 Tax=Paenibacillus sp. YYML68 TaxID=2909250 RepID=UPI00248FC56D|nr:EAL domain-containing protein [Paenibacillus sp. YYML68]
METKIFHPDMNPNRRPTWYEVVIQQVLLLRLWFVFVGSVIVLLSLRQLVGIPNGVLEYIQGLSSLLITLPLLYIALRHASRQHYKYITAALATVFMIECIGFGLKLLGLTTQLSWWCVWFDLLYLLIVTTPMLFLVASDIVQRAHTVNQLTHLAYHDSLTGLPNRQKFQQSLGESIDATKLTAGQLSVILIDLDRFKHVNETFGHAFGDQLLIEASERLKDGLHAAAVVSRQGGDEFSILVENTAHPEEAEKTAQTIIHLLNQPFSMDGHLLRVGCSVGIAMYPRDGEDAITLMKNADTALYQAKERGKNGYRFFQAEMNDTVIQKLVMEEWLNQALEQEEFMLLYQPQVDIFTNRVNGMEALIRWNHPRLGFISPGDFIPLAEETGLIIPIGEWVLRTACKQNKAWQVAGFAPLKVAVNISPIQFYQEDFVRVVLHALEESGLEPQYLELEITEGIAMYNVEQVIEKLQMLRGLGVHISMDDFGTGYSSLSYLKKFPITKLKIAQQFVRDITVDPDDAAIVQAIMAMASSLKLNVIAEGVETEEQLSFLLDVKCREIQGYIYSKPIPVNEFTSLLQRISS